MITDAISCAAWKYGVSLLRASSVFFQLTISCLGSSHLLAHATRNLQTVIFFRNSSKRKISNNVAAKDCWFFPRFRGFCRVLGACNSEDISSTGENILGDLLLSKIPAEEFPILPFPFPPILGPVLQSCGITFTKGVTVSE